MEIIALVQKMGKHKALKNLFLAVQEKWFKEIKRFFAESVTSLIKKLLNSIDPFFLFFSFYYYYKAEIEPDLFVLWF